MTTSPQSVLLIEDEAGLRELYEEAFQKAGWLVFAVGNGEEGLALALNRQPHAAVIDIMLPGMSGLDVLAALRQNAALENIPVIILSALEDIDDRARGLSLGAARYYGKNEASPQVILEEMESLLKTSQSELK